MSELKLRPLVPSSCFRLAMETARFLRQALQDRRHIRTFRRGRVRGRASAPVVCDEVDGVHGLDVGAARR
jgi:hypothetical protein